LEGKGEEKDNSGTGFYLYYVPLSYLIKRTGLSALTGKKL